MEVGTYCTATLLGGANPLSQGGGTARSNNLFGRALADCIGLRAKCAFALGAVSCPTCGNETTRRAMNGPAHKLHFYSINSSARPLSESGTVMPSALAVLRLIMSSTLVTLWTGRSPGFAPLRIFPV